MKRLLPILVIFLAGFPCFAKEHDFSGAYNRPVVPDPEVVEVIAPVFAQLSGHASGDIYVPSNYKIIFGDVTSTDVAVHKTSANTITVEGNLTCTGATCGTTTAGGASYGTGGGTAQAQTVTPTPAVTSLTTGLNVCWLPIANNIAAAPTLAVAGLTAKPITKDGTVPLIKDDITTLGIACVIYDGTEFQLQVPLAGGVFSSSISTGSGASAAGATATGGTACSEGTSTGWTPTVGQDYKRCDNTLHNFVNSINGAAETPEPVFSAVPAGTKCLQSSGTSGLIIEAAAACGGAATLNAVGNPTASSSFQPTVDASVLFKQFNGANAVDIFHIQNKTANELFRVDSAGTLRFWDGSCTLSNSSLFCGTGSSVGAGTYITATNCKGNGTAASPSVAACGSAAAGMFSCDPAASTATCQVNTTAVTANSEIEVWQDAADGGAGQLNVTCNTALVTPAAKPILLSKSAGVSFTINLGTVTTNPGCFEYRITN